MSMIRVNPDSIREYAATAQTQFDAVRGELQALVNDAVDVRYFGPNAVEFKTRCGQMAADFAQRLGQDLGHIADAVRVSTSAVATSLGGTPISISVNWASVALPSVPAGDDSVEIDTSGLEALKPAVSRRIGAIDSQLSAHLHNLQTTDWQGQAKESAVAAVTGFTRAAEARADEARSHIAAYINGQIGDVVAGDR